MENWKNNFSQPIWDLGQTDSRLAGIYSTVRDTSTVEKFIHGQFLESAETYARRYSGVDYFQSLIQESFNRIEWKSKILENLKILDIGSGAGNSIIPLLRLCGQSEVIASDLSVPLLAILRKALIEKNLDSRCRVVQMNAEVLDFQSDSFDLVMGAAILHHLISPEKVIEGCARILKPGGVAVFYEPFELGNAMIKIIYRNLLEDPRSLTIRPGIRRFLKEMWQGLHLLKGKDKSAPIFQKLDDKWLFSRRYFEGLGEKFKFSDVLIYPIHGIDQMFETQVKTHLRLGCEVGPDRLPSWAWKKIKQFDDDFSLEQKEEMILEGCVVFKK